MSSALLFQMPLLPRETRPPADSETEITPPLRDDLARLRASLAPELAARISSASELARTLQRRRRDEAIPTTIPEVDRLLEGGLPRGRLIEIAARRSTGRFSIALSTVASATSSGDAAAFIDLGDHLDPSALEIAGAELSRVLWIRPRTVKEAVTSAELLIATGFPLVVAELGVHPLPGRRVAEASWVRLARAAEGHGAALLVCSPYPISGTISEAVISGQRGRAAWQGEKKTPRLLTGLSTTLRLEKHRHRKAGDAVMLRLLMKEVIR
ncbi:MAG TPA: hypothetical protein VMT00_12760 [Thermoanaerobaculia bacterium]|nr:hypothetical protein [Thermoanaerobaculia bacterium]